MHSRAYAHLCLARAQLVHGQQVGGLRPLRIVPLKVGEAVSLAALHLAAAAAEGAALGKVRTSRRD
jgi:hypothetical protein